MTTLLHLALFVALMALGVAAIVSTLRSVHAAGMALFEVTRPVQRLTPGRVELVGTLTASGPPIVRPGEPACACVVTQVWWFQPGKGGGWRSLGRHLDGSKAVMQDGTGTCEVDLGDAEVVGPRWRIESNAQGLRVTDPQLAERAGLQDYHDLTRIRLERIWIENGARVLLLGEAGEVGQQAGADYRSTRPRYGITGQGAQRVLVSAYGHGRTIATIALPAVASGFVGLSFLLTGALFALHHLRLLLALR